MIGTLKRTLWSVALDSPYRSQDGDGRRVVEESEANCVSSLLEDGMHAPLLDLDCPHVYRETETPGHGHLIIDVPMSWRRYKRLLKALRDAGILEHGYVEAALRRRHNELRLPGFKKDDGAGPPVPPPVDDEPPH